MSSGNTISEYLMFVLVSLFNDISTLVGYLMPMTFFRRTVVVLFNASLFNDISTLMGYLMPKTSF